MLIFKKQRLLLDFIVHSLTCTLMKNGLLRKQGRHLRGAGGPSPPQGKRKKEKKKEKKREKREKKKESREL